MPRSRGSKKEKGENEKPWIEFKRDWGDAESDVLPGRQRLFYRLVALVARTRRPLSSITLSTTKRHCFGEEKPFKPVFTSSSKASLGQITRRAVSREVQIPRRGETAAVRWNVGVCESRDDADATAGGKRGCRRRRGTERLGGVTSVLQQVRSVGYDGGRRPAASRVCDRRERKKVF